VENYKDVRLPNEVIFSFTELTLTTIVNDKYLYTQEEGDILKNNNLKIKKGKETLKLTVRPNGDIVKSDKTKHKKRQSKFLTAFFLYRLVS
jgi:phosphopantothenoylcysteine synthetase/decarboxylase